MHVEFSSLGVLVSFTGWFRIDTSQEPTLRRLWLVLRGAVPSIEAE